MKGHLLNCRHLKVCLSREARKHVGPCALRTCVGKTKISVKFMLSWQHFVCLTKIINAAERIFSISVFENETFIGRYEIFQSPSMLDNYLFLNPGIQNPAPRCWSCSTIAAGSCERTCMYNQVESGGQLYDFQTPVAPSRFITPW